MASLAQAPIRSQRRNRTPSPGTVVQMVVLGGLLVLSAVPIVVMLALAARASYAFARIQFPGRAKLFYLIILVMMIPGTILLTPHFILANQLGLRDNLLGLVIFYVAGGQPFAIFLLSSYFQS